MSNDVNFKKLNELEVIEEASESTYAVVEENGVPKRIPGKKIGGGLPEGGAPNQQLVTDGEGNVTWEEKPFYERPFVYDVNCPVTINNGVAKFTHESGIRDADASEAGTEVVVVLTDEHGIFEERFNGRAYYYYMSQSYEVVYESGNHFITSSIVNPYSDSRWEFTVDSNMISDGDYVIQIYRPNQETVKRMSAQFMPEGVAWEWEIDKLMSKGAAANQVLVTDTDGNAKWEDKPFGEGIVKTVLLEEQVLTFDTDDARVSIGFSPASAGEVIHVKWDGVEYVCTSFYWNAAMSFFWGNPAAGGDYGSNSDEPFLIGDGIIDAMSAGSYTVEIWKEEQGIKTIDPKYLPDNVGGGSLLLDIDWGNNVCSTAPEAILNAWDNGVAIIARSDSFEFRPADIQRTDDTFYYLSIVAVVVENGDANFHSMRINADGTIDNHFSGNVALSSGK